MGAELGGLAAGLVVGKRHVPAAGVYVPPPHPPHPVGKLFMVLAQVKQERAECILVCPRRLSAAQRLMLQSLPCTAQRNLKGPLDQLMRPSRL